MSSKGRRVPPPISVDQIAAELLTQPGLYVLEVRHDDGCPTIRTQRETDCTCQETEQVILSYADLERSGRLR